MLRARKRWLLVAVACAWAGCQTSDTKKSERDPVSESDAGDVGPGPGKDGGDGEGPGADAGPDASTPVDTSKRIRIHYQPRWGTPADWGIHYWGDAVANQSPAWGSPPRFDKSDDFGGYLDVRVLDVTKPLGFFPLRFLPGGGDPVRDVETDVTFAELSLHPTDANLAECWIEQGKPVAFAPPLQGAEPTYKISAANDFIDIGDGRVRLMFRVAKGSVGKVSLSSRDDASNTLEATWKASDDVNTHGVMVDLTQLGKDFAGKTFSYAIETELEFGGKVLRDTVTGLSLAPISFDTVTDVAEWARSGVIYELMVRTFADGGAVKAVQDKLSESGIDTTAQDGVGDLVGLRNKLDYLRELGVSAVWLTPVFAAQSFHGYDPIDYYDIDAAYGTLKDFKDLVQAAHCKDAMDKPIAGCKPVRIIVDFVQNHTANTTPWFVAALDPAHPDHEKYKDWFVWADGYADMFADVHPWNPAERLWHCRDMAGQYRCYHKIFWSGTPELNFHNPDVRAEIKSITKYWVEDYDVDGFRLDASKHIDQFDDNHSIDLAVHGTHVWWKEMNAFAKGLVHDVPVLLAGENRWDRVSQVNRLGDFSSDVSGYDEAKRNWRVAAYANDMDSQFDFGYRTALNDFMNGVDYADATFQAPTLVDYLNSVAEGTRGSTLHPNPAANPNHFFERFLSNHDVDRPASMYMAVDAKELTQKLKLAASLVLTVPGTPVIYYGEEYGKKGKNAGSDSYMREPMEWLKRTTFKALDGGRQDLDVSKTPVMCKAINQDYPDIKFITSADGISVEEQTGDAGSLLAHYRKLIALRNSIPLFSDSETKLDERARAGSVYAYSLSTSKALDVRELLIVHNRDGMPVDYPATGTDLLSGETDVAGTFTLAPYATVILKKEP